MGSGIKKLLLIVGDYSGEADEGCREPHGGALRVHHPFLPRWRVHSEQSGTCPGSGSVLGGPTALRPTEGGSLGRPVVEGIFIQLSLSLAAWQPGTIVNYAPLGETVTQCTRRTAGVLGNPLFEIFVSFSY